MRHLARHLFTLCSAVSLLLCVAVCVLWVRSYRHGDCLARRLYRPDVRVFSQLIFSSSRGRFRLTYEQKWIGNDPELDLSRSGYDGRWEYWDMSPDPRPHVGLLSRLGFASSFGGPSRPTVPHWLRAVGAKLLRPGRGADPL